MYKKMSEYLYPDPEAAVEKNTKPGCSTSRYEFVQTSLAPPTTQSFSPSSSSILTSSILRTLPVRTTPLDDVVVSKPQFQSQSQTPNTAVVYQPQPTSDPKIQGPMFWWNLHVAAAYYPLEASELVRDRMKGRILAIPYELACSSCRPHALAFVEQYKDQLDQIVSGRHSLGRFYVKFHNYVNKRYNKPEWTYEQSYKYYTGKDLPPQEIINT